MNRCPLLLVAAGALAVCSPLRADDKSTATPPAKHEHHALTDDQRGQTDQQANEAWQKLTIQQKLHLLKLHRALREMPAEDRKFIQDRVERFLTMSSEERTRLKTNNDRWKQMTPEERQKAREQFQKRRQEFEAKWRQEHPGEEPPPFMPHSRKTTTTSSNEQAVSSSPSQPTQ